MSSPQTTENNPMNKAFPMINRREAVYRLAILMGGAMIGSEVFLRGDSVPDKKPMPAFSDVDRATLDAVGATVVPKTDIPGAEAVDIGAFMIMMINECYSEKQHAIFQEGIVKLNATSAARFGGAFTALTPEQKTEVLNDLDKEQRDYTAKKKKDDPAHYFRMMKELSVVGYFSSEIGATQAVHYIEVPGAFHGDVPYKPGDRAWY
ncbi:MAG TPA: gluconate 2-dehydrogenase subunit 3 family protein [Opitutaceae bacterium]|nr:gluconate 2-dehydrogenase subunit 3 family protein [Opitutaceae bacterium]